MPSEWVRTDLAMMRLAKQRATVLLDDVIPVTLISWKRRGESTRARIMFADNTTREVGGWRIAVRTGPDL